MNRTAAGLSVGHCPATGKLSFTSRSKAREASRRHPDHMGEYRCDACGLFHIGHVAPAIIHGAVTRSEVYAPTHHARSDDRSPELEKLERLRKARRLLATGARRIRGMDREAALSRMDAEIARVVDLALTA